MTLSLKSKDLPARIINGYSPEDKVSSWFYEDEKGLDLIVEVREQKKRFAGHIHIRISWATVIKSVWRYLGEKASNLLVRTKDIDYD